mmetsp:Transcript_49124/g.91917  ORF Transcript_49124/g.91917 Transcript_49124/m.91917 type:complete len:132 (+) Transcript_49124:3-398(+)
MAWEDFVQHWDQVQIVDRSLDLSFLSIKPANDSKREICKACTWGCFTYWCFCRGPRFMCCPKRSSEETVDIDEKWCFCIPVKRKYKAYGKQHLTTRGIVATEADELEYDEGDEYDDDEDYEDEEDYDDEDY